MSGLAAECCSFKIIEKKWWVSKQIISVIKRVNISQTYDVYVYCE